jgi:DeoR/GlpR family transcriptional regulator of sugar metabolism
MPPKARQNSKKLAEKEERILLTVSAIEKQDIRTIREAARVFNISYKTLRR